MAKQDKEKIEEIFRKAGAYSAVFFMAFFVALVSASAFTPVDKTNADTSEVLLGYSNEGYSISLASFGNNESDVLDPKVGMTLTGTPAGEIAVEYDRLKVTTNSTTYKLYLGMSDTSQKLLNTSETGSGEYCENAASTANCYFSATANTPSGANALDVNTWGFAIPTKYGFDGEYITSGGKKSNGAEAITDAGPGEYVSSNSKFAAVPTVANSVMIATGNQKAEQGKNYYIYYGVKADTGKVSGTYEGTVVYTALAEASDSADGKITSVVPDAQKTLDNSSLPVSEQRITMTTTLYGSEEMISKVQDENDVTVTIGGKTCTDPQLSVPGNTGTGPIQVSCAQPTMNRWGSYDVAVTIGNYGQYNLRAGYSYYVPWADMEAHPGEYSMQQFTTKACSEVATPEAYTGSITDGNYQAVTNVPEVSLKDSRNESHVYRVRKLADGNCWMADNLRLTLDDSVALTSLDSDINYNMDTGEGWDGTTTPVR
ncbi:MAG: hypothetical protein Q4F60_03710, partial [Candidatus Saccharibacteria bacterium]|nr:hypothetical protein [Candidatus Saccharibacteria bacterium]